MPSTPNTNVILEVRVLPPLSSCQTSLSHHISHLKSLCHSHLKQQIHLNPGPLYTLSILHPCIQYATLTFYPPKSRLPFYHARLHIFVYICAEHLPPSASFVSVPPSCHDTLARFAQLVPLPSMRFEGVWDSLHFGDANIKQRVLGYVMAGWQVARRGVNHAIVGWNGVLLLYGPPGTGKTSLSGALMHKLCIRVGEQGGTGVGHGMFVRVRMESLLSKYFSESSERVGELFSGVRTLAKDGRVVGVLLDEIETLGMCRKGRVGGSEPGDGVRVVNALLGGLDSLRAVRNVVVICTSNLVEGIDEALVDRVDMRMYVGLPGLEARVRILEEVVWELADKGVVDVGDGGESGVVEVARVCEGVSGRALRKLGILAVAKIGGEGGCTFPVDSGVFVEGMRVVATEVMSCECGGSGEGSVEAVDVATLVATARKNMHNVDAANEKN